MQLFQIDKYLNELSLIDRNKKKGAKNKKRHVVQIRERDRESRFCRSSILFQDHRDQAPPYDNKLLYAGCTQCTTTQLSKKSLSPLPMGHKS